jgi:carbon monoxide dehydrogenase subunit G
MNNRGRIEASASLAHSPERAFEFLSDLRNHWRLEPGFVELDALDGDAAGGRVRLRGPLGVSRTARTRVLSAEAPAPGRAGALAGEARIGPTTRGAVAWLIEAAEGGARVTLSAEVAAAGTVDRLLLAAGGRLWLERLFRGALAKLDEVLAAER